MDGRWRGRGSERDWRQQRRKRRRCVRYESRQRKEGWTEQEGEGGPRKSVCEKHQRAEGFGKGTQEEETKMMIDRSRYFSPAVLFCIFSFVKVFALCGVGCSNYTGDCSERTGSPAEEGEKNAGADASALCVCGRYELPCSCVTLMCRCVMDSSL